jgi:hypothetical protein
VNCSTCPLLKLLQEVSEMGDLWLELLRDMDKQWRENEAKKREDAPGGISGGGGG